MHFVRGSLAASWPTLRASREHSVTLDYQLQPSDLVAFSEEQRRFIPDFSVPNLLLRCSARPFCRSSGRHAIASLAAVSAILYLPVGLFAIGLSVVTVALRSLTTAFPFRPCPAESHCRMVASHFPRRRACCSIVGLSSERLSVGHATSISCSHRASGCTFLSAPFATTSISSSSSAQHSPMSKPVLPNNKGCVGVKPAYTPLVEQAGI